LSSVGGTLFSKALVYYVIYDLKAPDGVGGLLAALIGTITLFVPVWQAITRRTSKRFVWICGSALSTLVWTSWYLVPPETTSGALPFLVLGGVASAAFYLTFWSMLPDTIEYGLFKTGVRAESLQFGLISLSQKVALGIGVGLLGILLDLIGYRANQVQSEQTLDGLRAILTILPAALSALSGLLMLLYPVDTSLHGRLLKVLAWRETRNVKA